MLLGLGNLPIIKNSIIYKIVQLYPKLKTFKVQGCKSITSEGLMALTALKELETIDLDNCCSPGCVSDEAICTIASNCNSLTSICLRHCSGISDVAMSTIGSCCKKLLSLDISYCTNITDDGLCCIANGCKALTDLQISGCEKLTDYSMLKISNQCVRLRSVNIKGCIGLTTLSMKSLEFTKVRLYKKK